MHPLDNLQHEIAHRVNDIQSNHPNWLCRKGCDGCCKRLADIPKITSAEWQRLEQGLARLPKPILVMIKSRFDVMALDTERPLTCPMLDRSIGACRVYNYRPIACRTYGFYVQRDKGLYCHDIENEVREGRLDQVLWGHQDSVERRLKALGDSLEITEWFSQSKTLNDIIDFDPK